MRSHRNPFAGARFAGGVSSVCQVNGARAHTATDAADDRVSLRGVVGRAVPHRAVALQEHAKRQERGTLVPIQEGMVLDQVPAERGRFVHEIGVGLGAFELRSGSKERRLGETDPFEPREPLGRDL